MTDTTDREGGSEYAELLARADARLSGLKKLFDYEMLIRDLAYAIRALEAKVRESEDEYTGYVATLGKALRDLSFAAQTTGGTAGRDDGLVSAIDAATAALSLAGVAQGMDLVDHLRADRDRLAEALAVEQRVAKGWQETAEKPRGERDRLDLEAARLAGEVERLTKLAYDWKRKAEYLGKDRERLVLMNESLGDSLDASLKAGAEMGGGLAKARENEARYLWLRDAEWPMDVWAAVTHRSNAIWDEAIDAARRAGDTSEAGSIRQSRKGEK